MSVPTRVIKRGMFGKPTLQWLKNSGAASGGFAKWVKEWTRYGEWTASLTPGAQSGDDYAAVEFTVNDMPLIDLKSIRYIYRMGSTEVIAPNVAIHVYDPNDIDNRADITLSHSHDDLGKTTLTWYKFDLLPATTGLFWYGNNVTGSGLVAHGTAGNLYTLSQYQADVVFSGYVISKITIEYGYYSTGTIGAAHIAKISVNEEDIILEPPEEEWITPGTAATNLGKAEDAAHTSGDTGVMSLGVRKDVAGTLASADGDYTPPQFDQMGRMRVTSASGADFSTMFGQPTLIVHNNGSADWQRGSSVLSTHQKGGTGWVARLSGGVQSGWDDAAEVYIPVNEMHLTDLDAAMWSWFQTDAEVYGLTMVIWCHDPTDFDKRAEITLEAPNVEKAAGWNAHELASTDTLIFYGENESGNTTCTTEATPYTWANYQEDAMFSEWDIYRISFSWGFYNAGYFGYVYLADVKINGAIVQLKPSIEEQLDMVRDDQAKALTTIPTWTFGEPTLRDSNDASAVWSRWQHQQTHTG